MALASLPCSLLWNHKKFNQQQPSSFCKSAVRLWNTLVMMSVAVLPSCIGPNFTKIVPEPWGQRDLNSSKPCIFPRTFCRQLLRRNLAEFSWLRFYNSLCCVCALKGEGGAGDLCGMDLTTWLKWIQYILDNSLSVRRSGVTNREKNDAGSFHKGSSSQGRSWMRKGNILVHDEWEVGVWPEWSRRESSESRSS